MMMNILDFNTFKKEKGKKKEKSMQLCGFREILALTSEGFKSIKIWLRNGLSSWQCVRLVNCTLFWASRGVTQSIKR